VGCIILNFFGLYLDPVYVLVLTVVMVGFFLALLTRTMFQTNAKLSALLAETAKSEATRLSIEQAHQQLQSLQHSMKVQIGELKQINGKD
jgi:hypothetical protein